MALVLGFLPLAAQSQTAPNYQWATVLPLTYNAETYLNAEIYSVAATPQNEVVVAGTKQVNRSFSAAFFGNQQLVKYDAAGEQLWAKEWTGNARIHNIKTGASGKIFVLGTYIDSVRLGPQHVVMGSGVPGAYFACLSGAGEVEWVKHLSDMYGSAAFANVTKTDGLALDAHGNSYITYSVGLNGGSFIRKFDAAGNPVMAIEHQEVRDLNSVDVDANGNIYVSGSCAEMQGATFGGTAVTPQVPGNGYNKFVARYTASGSLAWVKFVGDATCPFSQVRADNNGGVYWAGKLTSNSPFDTLTAGTTQGNSLNFYIARLDTAGAVLWARALDANASNNGQAGKTSFLEVDDQYNAIVTGYLRGSHDFGNGVTANTGGVAQHQFVLQCSPAGQVNWVKTAGGSNSFFQGHSIARAANGTCFVAGVSRYAIELDSIALPGNGTQFYPVLARLGSGIVSTAAGQMSVPDKLALYPNPASDLVLLQAGDALPQGQIVITDLAGKAILTATTNQTKLFQIHTSHWPAGMYLVRVPTSSGLRVLKLQKQ